MNRLGLFDSERPLATILAIGAAGILCVGAVVVVLLWPILKSPAHIVSLLFYEGRWLDRAGVLDANLPVTAYEIAPGNATWGDVKSEYHFRSSDSDGQRLQTRFKVPDQNADDPPLALMAFLTYSTDNLIQDDEFSNAPKESCSGTSIIPPYTPRALTKGACLTWKTDKGTYEIISGSMDEKTLEEFVSSLTPVSR